MDNIPTSDDIEITEGLPSMGVNLIQQQRGIINPKLYEYTNPVTAQCYKSNLESPENRWRQQGGHRFWKASFLY